MPLVRITCASCGFTWDARVGESVYYALAVTTHPCPACEAYTLSCSPAEGPNQSKEAAAAHVLGVRRNRA